MFALEDADHEMLALAGVVEAFKFDGGADAGVYRQFLAARASEDAPKDKRRTIATSHFEPTISPSGSASQDNRAGVFGRFTRRVAAVSLQGTRRLYPRP